MSAWILSIAGVCMMSVVVDLVLPSGQTAKYIKNIFGYIIVLVIIWPLPSIVKGNFDFGSIFESQEIVLQEDFIYQVNRDKLTSIEKLLEEQIEELGLKNVDVSISANIFTTDMTVDEIFVDLTNLVIDEKAEHIDIEKAIVELVMDIVEIEESKVVFSE